jgi:acetyltransferase-like isoleucine patch superfamily enzyme
MALMRNILNSCKKIISSLIGPRHSVVQIEKGAGCKISSEADIGGYVKNIKIGNQVSVHANVTITCADEFSQINIGSNTVIKPYSMVMTYPGGTISIGKNCSINPFCILYGHGGLMIGDNVRIAAQVIFIPANHNFSRADISITEQGITRGGIIVGNDVWIGAGAKILDGVIIGDGVVIGAGSVVTKSIISNSVVAGVPAKIIAKRGIDV